MHIIRNYGGLKELDKKEIEHFDSIYGMTPEDFKNEYFDSREYATDDLSEMFVISVETKVFEPETIDDGKYSVNILDIYTPRKTQKATLDYCGHIAFIDIKDINNERITMLYKDDECCPQPFSEWYESTYDELECSDGITPTKEEILDVLKLMVRAYCQDCDLELDINEDNVIVLQGL